MKNFKLSLNNIFKLIIIIALIIAALTKQQYSYYTFIRWLVMTTSIYFAFTAFNKNQKGLLIYFIATAVLFNPFDKFLFQKETWKIIDLLILIATAITISFDREKITNDSLN